MMARKMTVEMGKRLGMQYQKARELEEATIRTENCLLNQMSRYYAEVA